MTDNIPARREENNEVSARRTGRRSYGFENDNFYNREESDQYPVVLNRRIKGETRCKLCSLVPHLVNEKGYSFEEATDAERDLYRFVYTFWSGEDISNWLKKSYDYDVSIMSISRHISKHIPDPNAAMIDRVQKYRPDYMNKKFFQNMADTMKLAVMKYQGSIMTGSQNLSTNEFLAIAKTLKEWKDFLGEIDEDKTDKIIQAVGDVLTEVLEPHPVLQEEFADKFRERLEQLEQESTE